MMKSQESMEAYMAETMYENNVVQEESLNGMMKSSFVSCSYDEKSVTLAFPMENWKGNRVGTMHGGIICTAFDITTAAVARYFAGKSFSPTVSLDVKYLRPLSDGDSLVVTAKATAVGKRILQLTAEAFSEKTKKLIATSSSIYLNADTSKK